jgi:hypothetical protein
MQLDKSAHLNLIKKENLKLYYFFVQMKIESYIPVTNNRHE